MRWMPTFCGQPALAAGCVVLSACTAPSPRVAGPTGFTPPVAEPVFTNKGIDVGATGMEIDFGRAEPGAITGMTKLMGRGPDGVALACPGLRAARWADGTTLFFEQKPYDPPAFVGWRTASGSAGRTCAL